MNLAPSNYSGCEFSAKSDNFKKKITIIRGCKNRFSLVQAIFNICVLITKIIFIFDQSEIPLGHLGGQIEHFLTKIGIFGENVIFIKILLLFDMILVLS